MAMSMGCNPVTPNKPDAPPGVILVTLLSLRLAVYTLPAGSIVILMGLVPVLPSILDTPDGVILVTLSEPNPVLAIYTFPAESVIMP